MSPQPPEPFALTVRQRLVLEAVSARSQDIATLYEDALRFLQESRRTLRFYAPGHSVRLFMHDMPQIFDLPTLGSLPQLSAKVQALDPIWRAARQSGCRVDGSTSLDEFLERLTEVEDIVLSCLYREPSANFAAIDAILAEEEAGA